MTVISAISVDLDPIAIDGVTGGPNHLVHISKIAGGHQGEVTVVLSDISGETTGSTLTVNEGTWNGTTFTLDRRLGFITVLSGLTQSKTILRTIRPNKAIQIITTGDASTKAHVHVQGVTVQVSP